MPGPAAAYVGHPPQFCIVTGYILVTVRYSKVALKLLFEYSKLKQNETNAIKTCLEGMTQSFTSLGLNICCHRQRTVRGQFLHVINGFHQFCV